MKKFDINFAPNESNVLLCKNEKKNNINTLKHFFVVESFCCNQKNF